MRIAYISTLHSAPWGGSEELWYQSAVAALEKGNSIGLFIYDWSETPQQIKNLENKGVPIFRRKRRPSAFKRAIRKVIEKVSMSEPLVLNPYKDLLRFKPDIIIDTDGSTYYTVNDKNLSGILLQYYKGRYFIISQSNSYYHLPSSRQDAIDLFENAAGIFFVAEGNRKLAIHQLAYQLTKTHLIQNPLLLNNFDYMPMPPTSGAIHCALVGRFTISDKGQDILIEMMNESPFKNSDIFFHLYGSGEDRKYLEDLIQFYGLEDKIIIEGYAEDRNKIWEKCHCLLMCSHAEGTPLTLLEAMIAGRVCIVTNVGGNADWIKDGENGFIVDAPQKDLFSHKLQRALEKRNEWAEIGKAAHVSALKKIDKEPGKTLLSKIEEITGHAIGHD